MYDQSGEFHDADVVAAAGHDYFLRKNFTGICRVHKSNEFYEIILNYPCMKFTLTKVCIFLHFNLDTLIKNV